MYVTDIAEWGCEGNDHTFYADDNKGPMYKCTSCDNEFNFEELWEANQK